jgi:hypothetical protein
VLNGKLTFIGQLMVGHHKPSIPGTEDRSTCILAVAECGWRWPSGLSGGSGRVRHLRNARQSQTIPGGYHAHVPRSSSDSQEGSLRAADLELLSRKARRAGLNAPQRRPRAAATDLRSPRP